MTKRLFRTIVAPTAMLVVAAGIPWGATAAQPDRLWLPDVADSASISGPSLVRGHLLDTAGSRAFGRLVLVAWPRQEILSAMEPGDQVKLVPVAKAEASADGSFDLRIDPQSRIEQFTDPDGLVNFDLFASGEAGDGMLAFPAKVRGAEATGRGGDKPIDIALTLAVGSAGEAPANGPSALAPAEDKVWYSTLISNYSPQWDIVGEVYPGPNTTSDFVYEQSASSELGIAGSATGSFGTWTVKGTVANSSTATIDFPTQSANAKKVFQTQIRYGKYRLDCFTEVGPCGTAWESRPNLFVGGTSSYNAASAPTATYCSSYLQGSKVAIDQSTAITFTNGMDMSASIGIDLSTKTGFTTKAKISFTFTNAGKLCGSNTYPLQAARIVGK